MNKFQQFILKWKSIPNKIKINVAALVLMVLVIPVSVNLALNQARYRSRANVVTPPTPPNPDNNPISWTTPQVSLKADDFYIIAGGKKYTVKTSDLTVHSDPGNNSYTTLEGTWHENETEMRMFWYFYAEDFQTASSSSRQWGVSEIRTYDGQTTNPDWIYYGQKTPLALTGIPYKSDWLNLFSNSNSLYKGEIHFKNLELALRFQPSASPTPSPKPSTKPSPSLSPKPSAKPSPSLSPKPSAKPSPTPSIKPSPKPINNPPLILTNTLKNARRNRQYSYRINGIDLDKNDSLFMSVTDLPQGIKLDSCREVKFFWAKYIYCFLRGKPVNSGKFNVTITLQDNQGVWDQKTLPLTVYK